MFVFELKKNGAIHFTVSVLCVHVCPCVRMCSVNIVARDWSLILITIPLYENTVIHLFCYIFEFIVFNYSAILNNVILNIYYVSPGVHVQKFP